MEYILIQFTKGLDIQAYQEVSAGQVMRILDLDGNELNLPAITESDVVDSNPPRPDWAD